MKKTLLFVFSALLILSSEKVKAQTPADAVMMAPGVLCVDADYEFSWWNKYWEGTRLQKNDNIGTFQKHTITPMINLGIIKWLNFMASAPYIITHPTAGYLEGVQGLPDFHAWVKVEPFRKHLGIGTFNVLATVGFTVPVTEYVPDYIYAIGMRCPEGIFKVISQYQFDFGLYVRAHGGYALRGYSKLQRNYYYTTQGYYSNTVDLPDAMDYSGAVGFYSIDHQYKAEIKFDGMNTIGGFDVRRWDVMFPSNKANFTRLSTRFEYYPKKAMGLGIHLNGGYVLTGRNVGRAAMVAAGVNYAFRIWTPGKLKARRAAKKNNSSK
jgi:hypothetical protein